MHTESAAPMRPGNNLHTPVGIVRVEEGDPSGDHHGLIGVLLLVAIVLRMKRTYILDNLIFINNVKYLMPRNNFGSMLWQLHPQIPEGIASHLRPKELLHDVKQLGVRPQVLGGIAELVLLVQQDGHARELLVDVGEPAEKVLVGVLLLDLACGEELLHQIVNLFLPTLYGPVEHVMVD